jgi:cytochrome P450
VLPSAGEHPSEQHTTAVHAACDRHLSGWPDFGLVDISRGAAHLALDILVGAVLGLPGGAGADRVLDDLVQHVLGLRSTGFPVPSWATAVGRLRARRAVAGLGAVPTAGRGDRLDPGGVAALVAAAARRQDQGGRSDPAVTDELVALLLIGHETVALALAYTCWLLATHTEIQEELAEELDGELTGGPATPAATARVPLLRAVVTEALRLFPPVWATGREVVHPTELDGYPLAPGARVLIPVWTIHRRPDWYDRPDEFRPDRWLGNREAGLPTAAYLPFGLGHRRCIGDCFAYQELTLAVAEILPRFRLGDCSGPPALLPSITLRTRTPIRLLVERR